MSFLNRMMASVGIGSARVETQVENAQVRAGGDLRGTAILRGGSVPQQVDGLHLFLMTQYRREEDGRYTTETLTLARVPLTGGFTLNAGEERRLPFAFRLPDATPVTVGHTRVWLKTGLDVPMAVDPTDHDELQILPHQGAQVIFDALHQLGFRIRQAEVEYSRRLGRQFPIVQQFEFVPTSHFRGRLEELEIAMFPDETGVELYMEVDRRARGLSGLFAEALDMDETRMWLKFEPAHLAEGAGGVAYHLSRIIEDHLH